MRWLLGLAAMPTAALTFGAALQALAGLAVSAPAALPFLAGLSLTAALWAFGRWAPLPERGPAAWAGTAARTAYVFGHELTHALAAWSVGAKLLGFKVGERGGHVDLSETNAFISLAPYCFPVYTAAAILGYRGLLWLSPGAWPAGFLALAGLTLSFHLLKTFEVLWDRRQPDLAAAGGAVFSVSCILFFNGLGLLLLCELLFPSAGSLTQTLGAVGRLTGAFWRGVYDFWRPVSTSFVSQMSR